MYTWKKLLIFDLNRRMKSGFTIGYSIVFPLTMIILLGYLLTDSFTKEFTGYEYYTLVMVPFCCMMAVITAAYAGKEDSYAKTAFRLLIAPISERQIFSTKLVSCTIVFGICNVIVLSIPTLIGNLFLRHNIQIIIVLLTAEAFCVSAIGLYIGLSMKNFITVKNFLNIPICLFAILGGSFYQFGTLNKSISILIYLSPLTWINRSIFLSIYDGNNETLYITTIILFGIGVIFTILGMKSFKREEFINGDLLGYEK